jgi:hypothetical protein
MDRNRLRQMRNNLQRQMAQLPVGPAPARPRHVLSVTFNWRPVNNVNVTVEQGFNNEWGLPVDTMIQEMRAIEDAIRQQYPNEIRPGDTIVKSNEPINPPNAVNFVAVNREQQLKRDQQRFNEIMAGMAAPAAGAGGAGAPAAAPAGGAGGAVGGQMGARRKRRRTQKKRARKSRRSRA